MKNWLTFMFTAVIFLLSFRNARSIQMSGIVTDLQNNAIEGATVRASGSVAALTDHQGKFSITVTTEKVTLVVSAIGYQTLTVKTNSSKPVHVKLTPISTEMNEVVTLGNGSAPKDAYASKLPAGKLESSGGNYYRRNENQLIEDANTEDYDAITENRFRKTSENPFSTFSIDVDAASYSNVRRFLNGGQLPPTGAVRTEELINYFHYDYLQPKKGEPLSITTELGPCPWNNNHQLVVIGFQAKKIPVADLPAANLVFLIDVSGSMQPVNKLPLVKTSLKLLVDQMREKDKISIVVYAGSAGLVLNATSGDQKLRIRNAIDELQAGGSTAGGQGIKLAYKIAGENFIRSGNNRVILCTDGDFNVGASSDAALEEMIEEERKSGVFLTVLGYGMGNYKDNKMQKLADKGNGNHAYIDSEKEAKKVLVHEFGGTLFTIARDVKLQVEFNPANVQAYRLIGYENRMLQAQDFNNDRKDAGELGSGHTVTAIYEIIPPNVQNEFDEKVDALKYSRSLKPLAARSELLTIKIRYKNPDEAASRLMERAVIYEPGLTISHSSNFQFAAAVAEFGLLLTRSEFRKHASYDNVLQLAHRAVAKDPDGLRSEFIELVKRARDLSKQHGEEESVDIIE